MFNSSFPGWPNFTQEEVNAVSSVLLSNKVNYWTGQVGRLFEEKFSVFAGTKYAIALANGTVALDLALHGLKIGSRNGGRADDEVIVTSRSFIASVSSIVNAGAQPVFADVDRSSGNVSGETILPVLSSRTRAVLAVHLAGWPCDMDGLRDALGNRDIRIIEDCAQAHGAMYKGIPVGSLGDIAAWSFCQDKIMTTGGEGGMVTCSDDAIWRRMWAFKDHGKSYEAVYEREHPEGFRWLHESIGTNWRLTEMQSAIGLVQLERMPKWQAERAKNAAILTEALLPFSGSNGPLRLETMSSQSSVVEGNISRHAWYKYYAYIRPGNLKKGWDRDRIVREISALGVPCMQGSCSEIYLEKAFDNTRCRPKTALPIANELGKTSVMFLVHPGLSQEDLSRMTEIISSVLHDTF